MNKRRTSVVFAILAAVIGLLTVSLASVAGAGDLDCDALANSPLAEPEGYAEQCLDDVEPTPWGVNAMDPTDTAFALDIGFVSDNFVSHVLNDFPGQTILGPNAQPIFAMDFDETATTLYAIDNTSRQLGTLSLANGAFSPIAAVSGIPGGDNISGLAIDPATGTAYVTSLGTGMTLYTMDLSTAVATSIGGDPNRGLLVDITMNCDGDMYGHDISTDSIYSINTTTGAATLIGQTGVNSNFAQGMDFDNADGTLYAYTYQGGGANVYGTIDTGTGALTPLASSNPQGEFEGATQTTCGGGNPGIAIDKSASPSTVTTNGIVTFTITVSNTGDVDLNNVTVSDPLVPVCDNAIGTMAVSATVSYNCTDKPTSSYTNTVVVTSQLVTGAPGPTATASAAVTYTSPTSVSLAGFGEDATAFSPALFVVILALVVGFGYAIRRKVAA